MSPPNSAALVSRLVAEERLYFREEVPSVFHEFAIQTGYRKPHCSWTECVRSAFVLNNETLNFWTHFLPFWYFVWTLRDFCLDAAFVADVYHWPYLAYLGTVCVYPIVSCLAHLFSVISEQVRHFCFFVDYLALTWYSFGSALAYSSYCFETVLCGSAFGSVYVPLCALLAVLCTTLSCESRLASSVRTKKTLRVLAFSILYVTVAVPLLHRIVRCGMLHCSGSLLQHIRHMLWSSAGLLVYAFHIPECFFPRTFDILGHSHQIFHICGILSTYEQMWALFADISQRSSGCATEPVQLRLVAAVLLCNVLVLCVYACRLGRKTSKETAGQPLSLR